MAKHKWEDITDLRQDLKERRRCSECGVVVTKQEPAQSYWMRTPRSVWQRAGRCTIESRIAHSIIKEKRDG